MPQHNVLERPKIRERIISLVLAGQTDAQIAVAIQTPRRQVTRRAIGAFRDRHSDEIQAAIDEAASRVVDVAIKDKEERIRRLSCLYDDVEAYQAEHGLAERSVRYDKDGSEIGETIRFAAPIVAAKQAILRDVKAELTVPTKGGAATLELEDPNGNKVRFSLNLGTEATDDHD